MKGKAKDFDDDRVPVDWPRVKLTFKDNHAEIKRQDGRTLIPIPPPGVPGRAYEKYKIAKECLLENLKGPLVSPAKYKKLFEELNLHQLSLEVMRIRWRGSPAYGQIRGICIVCHSFLTGHQKLYCSDQCRNTEKQRRGRDKHPERKLKR